MSVPTFTKTGTKATTAAKLDSNIFGLKIENHELLKQAYNAYLANGRENLAKTLRRGEVRGGGRKPWKQKGTGRARFGSSRTPIWRKGGVVFGPLGIENYSQKLNIKSKRQALRQALSMKASSGSVIVIETFECKNGKASDTVKLMDKIGAKRNILLVVSVKDELVKRATNNLSNIKVVQASYLNAHDVIDADNVVISQKSLEIIDQILGQKKEAK